MNRRLVLAALVALGVAAQAVHGDELKMEAIGEPSPTASEEVSRPTRGMKMEQVIELYGEPRERLPAVGQPPITRWVYDGYTVYFEHEYTITSVLTP